MKCNDCGNKITLENRIEVRNPYKAFVCKACADKSYAKCEPCNRLYINELIAYSGSVQCCDKCANRIARYTRMGNPIWD